jgi:hypothetical protein
LAQPELLDMEDNDARNAKTLPSELELSLEELNALLEYSKGENLSADTLALFLSRLRISDVADDVPLELRGPAINGPFSENMIGSDIQEIDTFLDECRGDRWFQDYPELLERLEAVLIKFYIVGEGPEWQLIWDRVCEILERKSEATIARCEALVSVLQDVTKLDQIV